MTGKSAEAKSGAGPFAPYYGLSQFQGVAGQAAHAGLVYMSALESGLAAWRNWLDATRSVLRSQQDAALAGLRGQLAGAASAENGQGESAPSQPEMLLAPFYAAAKAYEQVGQTMLQAQRRAIEAMTPRL